MLVHDMGWDEIFTPSQELKVGCGEMSMGEERDSAVSLLLAGVDEMKGQTFYVQQNR